MSGMLTCPFCKSEFLEPENSELASLRAENERLKGENERIHSEDLRILDQNASMQDRLAAQAAILDRVPHIYPGSDKCEEGRRSEYCDACAWAALKGKQ